MIGKLLRIGAAVLPFVFSAYVLAQTPAGGGAGDDTMEVESQVPGTSELVRWDALLNQSGADAVKKVGTPVKTTSNIYEGMTCGGFDIRSTIADAFTNGGVMSFGQNMEFSNSYNNDAQFNQLQPLNVNYFGNGRGGVQMNGYFQGNGLSEMISRTADGGIHLTLNESNFQNGQIRENGGRGGNNSRITVAPTIQFDGNLAPGDAVVFMAPFTAPSKTVYYQVTVWESFKVLPQMMDTIRNERDAQWWTANGPSKLRKAVATAAIWGAQATHAAHDAPAEFVKKLDDGKVVRLIALSKPGQYPFIWWDAKGNPVAAPQNVGGMVVSQSNADMVEAMVEMQTTPEEDRKRDPTTQPVMQLPNNGMFYNAIQPMQTLVPKGATSLDVGVAVGDWKEIGQLNLNEEQEIDGVKYKVTTPRMVNGNRPPGMAQTFPLTIQITQGGEDMVAISPVNAAGKEAVSQGGYFQPMIFGHNKGASGFGYQFQGFSADDVKYVRLCIRTRQFVTFDGFATDPGAAMKTDFTQAELDAALKSAADQQQRQRDQQNEEAQMRPQIFRTQFDMMPDNLNTAPGTLRALMNAAQRGDEKALRGILTPPNDATDPGLDLLAHLVAVSSSNLARAKAHFSEGDMLALKLSGVPLEDLGSTFHEIAWSGNGDGSWTAGQATMAKNSDGTYYVDLRPMLASKDAVANIQAKSAIQDKIAKALDKGNATVDDVRAAAQ